MLALSPELGIQQLTKQPKIPPFMELTFSGEAGEEPGLTELYKGPQLISSRHLSPGSIALEAVLFIYFYNDSEHLKTKNFCATKSHQKR